MGFAVEHFFVVQLHQNVCSSPAAQFQTCAPFQLVFALPIPKGAMHPHAFGLKFCWIAAPSQVESGGALFSF
jgi:hypothetical protein